MPRPETHGSCSLTLEIKTRRTKTTYRVLWIDADKRLAHPVWRLCKIAAEDGAPFEPDVYDVAVTEHGPTCTCADFTFIREKRGQECKHVKSLRSCGLLPKGKP